MTHKRLWMSFFLSLYTLCQIYPETSYSEQSQANWNETSRPDRTGQERLIRRHESTSMPRATQRANPERNLDENRNLRRFESTDMPRGGGRYIPNNTRSQSGTDSTSENFFENQTRQEE